MNTLDEYIKEPKPPECPCCDDGFLLEAGEVLVCSKCYSEAIACPRCGALNDVDSRIDSTTCEECEEIF